MNKICFAWSTETDSGLVANEPIFRGANQEEEADARRDPNWRLHFQWLRRDLGVEIGLIRLLDSRSAFLI